MTTDVIVIGAGAAGLAAARALARKSLRVVVLEGRDRVGGRVRWSPSSRDAVPAELGAEFIHGPAKETMALLREIGSAAVDTGGESWSCDANGRLQLTDDDFFESTRIFDRVADLERDESVETYLQRFERDEPSRILTARARAFVEGFDAADPAIASARGIADEWESGTDYSSTRPIGGYRVMFEYLRDSVMKAGVDLRLSTTVKRIAWRRGEVVVETSNGSFHARAAIVTLPVGVLRDRGEASVVFDPGLPEAKREALAHIEMGPVIKVSMWFRTPFWERVEDGRYRDSGFFRGADGPFATYWAQLPVRSEMIVAWAGGPKARALHGIPDVELIQRAVNAFGELFGDPKHAQSQFEGGIMHDWSADPFARGAYSYLAVGGEHARAQLAAPLDTLFFAGEAMSGGGEGGTVNGAFQTGERAAGEVARCLF